MQPLWVRALLAIDRALVRAVQIEAAIRDELLWAWLPAAKRRLTTDAIYAAERTYVPGQAAFERGLLPWEERLLARSEVPRSGRVLVGGAGGGRELKVLAEHGYAVTGFERSAELVEIAKSVVEPFAGSHVLRGSYEDLEAASHGRGPLGPLRAEAPYAFVLLGWGSLSHLLEEHERTALFSALARLTPGSPVIASFAPHRSQPGRARRMLRRTFAACHAPASAPRGALFLPWAGFVVELDRVDLERAAAAGGYSVLAWADPPDGYALLGRRPS